MFYENVVYNINYIIIKDFMMFWYVCKKKLEIIIIKNFLKKFR